jgi:3-methylcrotonyl-CoA carboxylase alpha subunit
MFTKILIANRGEIACRIARTCRRLGVRTVAVYSDADRDAQHVRACDEAVHIGPAPSAESYLQGGRIVAAAVQTGAQAIHPGYGFLSENASFAELCAQAGLSFIGPPVKAIHAMGSKSEAKRLMADAGVPLVPGFHGDEQDAKFLQREAERIGWPVLIKAAMGGGGKGMRIVNAATEFAAALQSCQREARSSFGDERVLLEKYLEQPRHVEVQVFGDTHGGVVSLFDRDCSAQRRHQKVIEEAPAWGLPAAQSAAMGHAAREAARSIGYVGAGTVEFIVDRSGTFYFMEMNTRLQVEHPVTEMITGLDLVEWQLRIASGEPLPLRQEQLQATGAAVEVRLYAERPDAGFLPSVGRLQHFRLPPESLGVRVDTGVATGDEVTGFYDPMLAKLIVHDVTRERAIDRMLAALRECQVVGVHTNLYFLARLLSLPAFRHGDVDTHLIERESAQLLAAPQAAAGDALLAAAAWQLLREQRVAADPSGGSGNAQSPWRLTSGWRLNGGCTRELQFGDGEALSAVSVQYQRYGWLFNGQPVMVLTQSERELAMTVAGRRVSATLVEAPDGWHVFCAGVHALLVPHKPIPEDGADDDHGGGLTAPMSGVIVQLLVTEGAAVMRGAPLLAMEAMKMEHKVCAPADGVVKQFLCAAGAQVREGQELVEFELS